ncbi:hypothetical protein V3468_05990 [Flavobacterium oreochromis]
MITILLVRSFQTVMVAQNQMVIVMDLTEKKMTGKLKGKETQLVLNLENTIHELEDL